MDFLSNAPFQDILLRKDLSYFRVAAKDTDGFFVKLLNHPAASEDLKRFEYDHSISSCLSHSGILRSLKVTLVRTQLAIVYEDFDGNFLKSKIPVIAFNLPLFLNLAIKLAEILYFLEETHICHLRLSPYSVLVSDDFEQVKLINFSDAKQNGKLYHNETPDHSTAAYFAPEQHSHIMQVVDHRTDLYSFGILLFELLTNRMPGYSGKRLFEGFKDHFVPFSLKLIIEKLVSHNPEDRYQSAAGILYDLRQCSEHIHKFGEIKQFFPGQTDTPGKIRFNETVYGRDHHTEIFRMVCHSISTQKSQLLFVSGEAGIGKSAFIRRSLSSLSSQYFIIAEGKYDALQSSPFSAISSAFSQLIDGLIRENRSYWKTKLATHLSFQLQVISEVIPGLEKLVGEQPPLFEIAADKAKTRLLSSIRAFLAQVTEEKPVILFLDDIHWADSISLDIISYLTHEHPLNGFLIIGTYRIDASETPLFASFLSRCDEYGNCKTIVLDAIDQSAVEEMVENLFNCQQTEARYLAQLLHRKTQGNPLFIRQFLVNLEESGDIIFALHQRKWLWDIQKLHHLEWADNIAQIISKRIYTLPADTRDILKVAACLGSVFLLADVARILDRSPISVSLSLWQACHQELICALESDITPFSLDDHHQETMSYKFLHDNIRQAAYELIPAHDRSAVHVKIGWTLLDPGTALSAQRHLLDIAYHLNIGRSVLSQPSELKMLAEINYYSGKKAKSASSFSSALRFFKQAAECLTVQSWEQEHPLTYQIFLELGELEYLCGHFNQAETIFQEILSHCVDWHEVSRVYNLQIILQTNSENFRDAILLGLHSLSRIHRERIPEHPSKFALVMLLLFVRLALKMRKNKDVFNLPRMSDEKTIDHMQLYTNLATPAFFSNKSLFAYLILRMVLSSLKKGNSPDSSYSYLLFGFILCSKFSAYQEGYHYAKLAVRLNEKFQNEQLKSKLYLMLGGFVLPWVEPMTECFNTLSESFQAGIRSGDLLFCGYAQVMEHFIYSMSGLKLDEQAIKNDQYLEFAKQINYDGIVADFTASQQAIKNLQGKTYRTDTFDDHLFNEKEFETQRINRKQPIALSWFYILKVRSLYIFKHDRDALVCYEKIQKLVSHLSGFIQYTEFCFYYALTLARTADTSSSFLKKKKLIYTIHRQEKKFRLWSRHNPTGFMHKHLCLQAEVARLKGDFLTAERLYTASLEDALRNNFQNLGGIISERLFDFFKHQRPDKAAVYLQQAIFYYDSWGASQKSYQLRKENIHDY